MYIIALDLTTGDQAVETLKKWLALITPLVHHAYANFPAEKQESMRSKYLQYMLKARLTKGSAVEAVPEEHHEELTGIARFEFAAKHFALPIVVVGCKMELLDMTNSLTAKTVREIRGKLRALCLEAGAALVFTSTIEESEEMQQLRRYILHRLYPESISMSLQIEDRLQSTFVPSGFDTIDLIELSAGCKVEKEGLRNYFSTDSPDLTMKVAWSLLCAPCFLGRFPVSFCSATLFLARALSSHHFSLMPLCRRIDRSNWSDHLYPLRPLSPSRIGYKLCRAISPNVRVKSSPFSVLRAPYSNADCVVLVAAESGVTKSSNAILDAIQAEADASSAASERRRPDPIITSSTSSGKESGAAGASAATGAAPTAPPTKRASIIRTVNTTDKKDVGDFFKNLMETKPKK